MISLITNQKAKKPFVPSIKIPYKNGYFLCGWKVLQEKKKMKYPQKANKLLMMVPNISQ